VRVLVAIREPKAVTAAGTWHHGKMPRTAFPLSKSHDYSLGSKWHWAVWRLSADGRKYRLLVAFEPGKHQYQAWLGLESGSDQALLARLEYHPTHRAWHCHVKKGFVSDVGCGVVRHPQTREKVRLCRSREEFDVTELTAFGIARRVFEIVETSEAGELFET
jgi:hypothetical protein